MQRSARISGLIGAAVIGLAISGSIFAETDSAIARGGKLYDKWWAVTGQDAPEEANPAYPAEGAYSGKKGADWRCKECHGWDYRGADGAYGSGKHHTGIKGIGGAAGGDPEAVLKVLADANHGYDKLLDGSDLSDLAMFVVHGQTNADDFIDAASKTPKGNAEQGAAYYNTVCANCHGKDGKEPEDMEPLGALAAGNPWEVLHKVMNGQPDENMPAMRAFDPQVAADILAHVATLPAE